MVNHRKDAEIKTPLYSCLCFLFQGFFRVLNVIDRD